MDYSAAGIRAHEASVNYTAKTDLQRLDARVIVGETAIALQHELETLAAATGAGNVVDLLEQRAGVARTLAMVLDELAWLHKLEANDLNVARAAGW